jgi:ketosteroid isomerase-like protein
MSQENVEIVRAIYDEWAEGRFTTHLHLFDPDVEYTRSSAHKGDVLEGEWHGFEAMTRAALEWVETFELLRIEAEHFTEVGDSVLVFTRHTGQAKASGLPTGGAFADVWTLRDGRVVRLNQYRERTTALEAVGLRE